MYMRKVCWKALILTLVLAGAMSLAGRTQAQNVQALLDWNASWRYAQNGAELGTAWRAFTYNDTVAPWNPGQGILAGEDTPGPYLVHGPINTTLAVSGVVTTYYFRATFNFSGSTAGLNLVATNLIDDGAVIYLNGTEVGRFRIP